MKRTIVVLALLTACSAGFKPAVTVPQPRDRYIAAQAERAWTALLVAYTDFGIPIKDVIRTDYFLRSDQMRLPAGTVYYGRPASYYFDCGTYDDDPIAGQLNLLVDVTTLLRAAGDSTAARITVQASGRFQDTPDRYECVSLGTMEDRIIELVANRVRLGN